MLILNSCKTQYSTTVMQNNFSEKQIKDLEKITVFFKESICLSKNPKFKKCFEKLPHEYMEAVGSPVWSNINFEKQKKLYKQISDSTFNQIWVFCKSINFNNNKKTLKSICSRYNGKYQKYLIDFGKQNEAIKVYANKVVGAGVYPTLYLHYSHILRNKKYFDLNDPNIQLIIAIHYLSLNDEWQRTDEWESE